MILYINACVRKSSRTELLAGALLKKLDRPYKERKLEDLDIAPLTEADLEKRADLLAKGEFSDPFLALAKEFAEADTIVVSAPYWDLSFPALLKVYLENIYAIGLVSRYSESGDPIGLCKAEKLYYVTTAGGKYISDYSFDYMTRMAKDYFGIKETKLIKAEFLDIVGNDAEKIVSNAIETVFCEEL